MKRPVVDIAELAKQSGVAVTALSALAYACGYLTRAARARALGTDPDLALISQAYVYTGFRFGLFTLLAFLVVLPLVILLRAVAERISSALRPDVLAWVQIAAVAVLAVLTLVWYGTTLRVSDTLLHPAAVSAPLCEAVFGGSLGLALILAGTALTTCSILSLRALYFTRGFDTLSLALSAVVLMCL